ncbi:DUF6607 family protein [Aquisalimonas asiatica]|uniref:Secreted protein n=1 Tax=Aquisalimonas asiatica TaxID=406100 RepID=A0A1H8S5R2_9GAMM|nr:DUF6607 family protein [Aquisalimonas asiatica]SEO73734.1 hypothetical protein SAMN04488052_102497 [Aquisalimonas asiatica]
MISIVTFRPNAISAGLLSAALLSPANLMAGDGNDRLAAIQNTAESQERDRRAILAMAGEYEVAFHFRETVPLKPGYERQGDQDSHATEVVLVVEDSPERIVLQHILLGPDGEHVTKHWRQDWHFEAQERLQFTADQTWQVRPVPEDLAEGSWTQCVWEVSDAPRYCGTGHWNHRSGVSTWTSDRTWRPLPRREYTARSDYNALNVENRHTITPDGWTHEQDNTKVRRDGEAVDAPLVREFGFNEYRLTDGVDFSPVYDEWDATGDFWAQVRQAWQERIDAESGIRLTDDSEGMAIIRPLFEQAATHRDNEKSVDQEAIDAVLERWTSSP